MTQIANPISSGQSQSHLAVDSIDRKQGTIDHSSNKFLNLSWSLHNYLPNFKALCQTCNSTIIYRKSQKLVFVPKTKQQGYLYLTIGLILEILPFYFASQVAFDFNTPRMVYLLCFVLFCLYVFLIPGVRPFYPDKRILCLESLNDILDLRRLEKENDSSYGESVSGGAHQTNANRVSPNLEIQGQRMKEFIEHTAQVFFSFFHFVLFLKLANIYVYLHHYAHLCCSYCSVIFVK